MPPGSGREPGIDRLDTRDPGRGVREGTPRSRQRDRQREIGDEIGVRRDGVAVRDQRGGIDAFLRSTGVTQFGNRLRSQFADAADFVRESDVAPNIDRREIAAEPAVAPGRRNDVAQRAESQAASDADFVTAGDLEADVGARGVTDLGIPEPRRDDVADRAREGLAAGNPFAQPSDFEADVTESGIESAGLTEQGARRSAARQFESETALGDVDPTSELTPTDDGFALGSGAQRRAAARGFESDFDIFGSGELDPETDIRETESGFGLGRDEAREVAAADLSEQIDTSVPADAIDLEPRDDGGFRAIFGGEN